MNVRHHTGSKKNQTPVLRSLRKVLSIREGQRTCDTNRKYNIIRLLYSLSVKVCWFSDDVQYRYEKLLSELVTVSKQSIKLSRTLCKPTLLHSHGIYEKNGSQKLPESGTQGTGFSVITMQMVTLLCARIFGYNQNDCHSKPSFKAT